MVVASNSLASQLVKALHVKHSERLAPAAAAAARCMAANRHAQLQLLVEVTVVQPVLQYKEQHTGQ